MVAEPRTLPGAVPPSMSLHRKLAEVMAEVERIPKNGTAPQVMGGFKFVQVGDAADAIRKALAERRVSMLPSQVDVVSETEHATKSGGTMTTQTLRTTWTLTDGDTGEQAVIQSIGTGADTGDKYSPKAQTSSMKYALLMGFLLSTGDDPELGDTSDRRSRRDVAAERNETAKRDGLIGTASLGKKDSDAQWELKPSPAGHVLIFRLSEGRTGWKVICQTPIAEAMAEHRAAIEDQRVKCWGWFSDESWEKPLPSGKTQRITYQVLHLTRIETPAGTFSEPDEDDDADDDPGPASAPVIESGAEAACGAVDGSVMDLGTCQLIEGHKSAHKSADGSWPL